MFQNDYLFRYIILYSYTVHITAVKYVTCWRHVASCGVSTTGPSVAYFCLPQKPTACLYSIQ